MDVIDPSIRRGLQIAAYQRDALFNRTPNIIPASLKMLVEPSVDRTMALLDSIRDEPFHVATFAALPSDINCDEEDPSRAVCREIADLAVVADRVLQRRAKYHDMYYKKTQSLQISDKSSERIIDDAMNACNIDSARLERVREYYKNLLRIHSSVATDCGAKITSSDRPVFSASVAYKDGLTYSQIIDALNRVSWHDNNDN